MYHHKHPDWQQYYSDKDNFFDQHNFDEFPYARAGRSRDTMVLRDGGYQVQNHTRSNYRSYGKENMHHVDTIEVDHVK